MVEERKYFYNDNRRIKIDRRQQRFGRRNSTIFLRMGNFLTKDPRVFYAYLIFSSIFAIIGLIGVSYNIPRLIRIAFTIH